jgi:hypothetical protein
MKFLVAVLLSLLSTVAMAQQDINQQLMRAMLSVQEATALQDCMLKLNPAEVQGFMKRAEHTKTQIDTLCANNERVPATDLAGTFVSMYDEDPTALKIKQCGELAPSLVPKFSVADFDGTVGGKHVCDL